MNITIVVICLEAYIVAHSWNRGMVFFFSFCIATCIKPPNTHLETLTNLVSLTNNGELISFYFLFVCWLLFFSFLACFLAP